MFLKKKTIPGIRLVQIPETVLETLSTVYSDRECVNKAHPSGSTKTLNFQHVLAYLTLLSSQLHVKQDSRVSGNVDSSCHLSQNFSFLTENDSVQSQFTTLFPTFFFSVAGF